MQLPLQISFRHMEHSDDIETLIRNKAAGLDKFTNDIMRCSVVVQPAGKHHLHGNLYEVRIDLTMAGEEIAVTHTPSQHAEYQRPEMALRDAFDTARRKVEDFVRRRRGAVKVHASQPHGRVTKLLPDEDFGYIETPEEREIYFHRNSVLQDAFDRLQVGMEVAFVEEQGDNGPQASTVKLVD